MPDVGLIKVEDYEDQVARIGRANDDLTRSMGSLMDLAGRMSATRFGIQLETEGAEQGTRRVTLAFETMEQEISARMANFNLGPAESDLSRLGQTADNTRGQLGNLADEMNRQENKSGLSLKEFGKNMFESDLTDKAIEAVTGAAGAHATSAYGQETGNTVEGALGGALGGAAIGFTAGGPIGAVVGGVIGLFTGLITASTKNFEAQEDAFRSVVEERYEGVLEQMSQTLSSGIETAGNREQIETAMRNLMGHGAEAFLEELESLSAQTAFSYESLATISRAMLPYGYETGDLAIRARIFSETGLALGMSQEDTTALAAGMGEIFNQETFGAKDMEWLEERGVDVCEALKLIPELAGKGEEELRDMVKNGLIPGAAASEAIVKHMNQMYTGTATNTFTGTAATYQNATDSLNNAMGEGYQEERLTGLHDQSQWLNGETGQQMKEDYALMGSWQGKIENEKERIWRETFEELYGTEEYKEAKQNNDYAKLSALYNQTWAMAEENWMQTGMYQQEMSMKTRTLEGIQGITFGVNGETDEGRAGWQSLYDLNQQFTKGTSQAKSMSEKLYESRGEVYGYEMSLEDFTYFEINSGDAVKELGTIEDEDGVKRKVVNFEIYESMPKFMRDEIKEAILASGTYTYESKDTLSRYKVEENVNNNTTNNNNYNITINPLEFGTSSLNNLLVAVQKIATS